MRVECLFVGLLADGVCVFWNAARRRTVVAVKGIGAIAQWTLSKKDNDVFKDYRREYKKRFARMKAGTFPTEVFYAWSKKAREKKPPTRRRRLHRINSEHGMS